MRPAFLLALAMWALLGWLALPGASATICPSSPYTMDSTKTSADLNGVLASWSNVSCTGSIIFTATAKTYYLADPTYIASGADFTLDARYMRARKGGGGSVARYAMLCFITMTNLTVDPPRFIQLPASGTTSRLWRH